jgi:drug/metabolite transporter (DMT)-like permease
VHHTGRVTILAITLAAVAAFCFAAAAVLQHRAVRASDDLRTTVRAPGWLLGLALAVAGTSLHATALVLAPLAVVQPIGVLAVPIAVLGGALRTRERPAAGVLAGAGLCLVGVATFVLTMAGRSSSPAMLDGRMLAATVGVAVVVAALGAAGLRNGGWVRCALCATAGAIAFGLVSALMRALSQAVFAHGVPLLSLETLATGAAMAAAVVGGGWLVQQAFAAGAPDVVVACLTVVDPVVAVLLGALTLGEGSIMPASTWVLLAGAVAIATAGVVTLASHHPEALARAEARR